MAYRRLPNTDNARLAAIVRLFELLTDEKVLINHQEIISYLKVDFEERINKREAFILKRRDLNKSKKELLGKLKLYVSHFLQVLNFAIDRNDISNKSRRFFKLEKHTGIIPPLSKEDEVLKWADNIIIGEEQRVEAGEEVISHPKQERIIAVKNATENVIGELKVLDKNYEQNQVEIQKQREKIDAFIKQMWNEIEFQFINEPIEIKRKKATHFGVVYVK